MNDTDSDEKLESWISRAIKHPLTISLYYFSIIAVAVVVDRYSDLVSREAVLLAAVGALILFVTIFGLTALSFRFVRASEIDDRVQDLKTFFAAQQMGWIVNDKYIRIIELGSPETWVFTRNLVNDLDTDGEIFQSVSENLNAGRKYKYFIPDSPVSYQTMSRYQKVHAFKPDQVEFYLIPEENFLFYTEVVAYNVHSKGQTAIEWLPLLTENDGKQSQFYIKMGAEHADYIVGIGEMFRRRYTPSELEDN